MSSNSNHARRNADHSDSADYDAIDEVLAEYDGPFDELAQELRSAGTATTGLDDCPELSESRSETDDESVSSVIRHRSDTISTSATDHIPDQPHREQPAADSPDNSIEAQNEAIDRRCDICFNDYYEPDDHGYSEIPLTTACNHTFGSHCINQILTTAVKKECPLCRRSLVQDYPHRNRSRSEPVRSTRLMLRNRVEDESGTGSTTARDASPPRLELLPHDEEWARTVAWAEEQDRLNSSHSSLLSLDRSDVRDHLLQRLRQVREGYEALHRRLQSLRSLLNEYENIEVRDFAIRDGDRSRRGRLQIEWTRTGARRVLRFGEIEVPMHELREASSRNLEHGGSLLDRPHRLWRSVIHRDVFVEHADSRTQRDVAAEDPAGPSNTPATQSPSSVPFAGQSNETEHAERVIGLNELGQRSVGVRLREMSPSEKDDEDEFDDGSGDDCDCSID